MFYNLSEKFKLQTGKNVKDVALDRVKNEEFDWIVIEVGTNEVSYLDLRKMKVKQWKHPRQCERIDKTHEKDDKNQS